MRLGICSVLLSALFFACTPANAQRLPTTVVPDHYDLAFDVDLTRARFSGVETIRARLTEPSRRIVLNALELQFQEVTISANGVAQRATVALDRATETAALTVPQPVPAGPAEIHIRYTGVLNDQLRGLYLSKANGRNYAVTQFESTDARRAFPSFDEPAFKATFSLKLTIDQRDTAISNGQLLSDTAGPGPGRHTLTFSETPKMSSYLVAMAVGDFQCIGGEAEGVPIRVCATPDKKALGEIALDASKQILSFYNRYYSIKYPFKKLDMVAVPDFAAGAMENTAAIFYREVDLLADAKTASVASLREIWLVIAHEMAHQWFGDLVTMRWWDDLWLNEGFASWMESRPLAAIKPEWKVDVVDAAETERAKNLDALASTRPIHAQVETPAEIEGSFDAIAYQKGAAVMRMIEGYLGADVFRNGVNAYLDKHAYSNATSADFWNAMTAASGKPIDKILPTFVNQPGVPLLDVALRCDAGRTQVTMTEQRFFIDPNMARTSAGNPVWQIPVCMKTAEAEPRFCQVVGGPVTTVPLNASTCAPWVFVNAGAEGYFRTSYPPEMLRALAPDVETKLTAPERLTLVGDEWSLVHAGRHNVGDYLTLASGFGKERTNGVFSEVATRLTYAHDYLTTDQSRSGFERFVRMLVGPMLTELGLNGAAGDDDDRRELRATVIRTLSNAARDNELSSAARTLLERSLSGGPPLESTAADAIVGAAARRGDLALWDRLLRASKEATSPAEGYRYLYALPAFEDPALIDRSLNLALTPDVRSQDTPIFLGRFMTNPAARPRAWAFIKEHWKELAPKVTISLGDVSLVNSLRSFCDAGARDDIRRFFTTNKVPAASRTLDQTIENINNCVALGEKQTAPLTAWLASQNSGR